MTTGVVVGKFWPLHKGHEFLLTHAVANADQVFGMVVQEPHEKPAGGTRLAWAQELFPQIKWTLVNNEPGRENDSPWWAKFTHDTLVQKFNYKGPIDVVFTSENYGDTWAEALGCDHHKVDLDRKLYSVSGTACRADPMANWDYLSTPAKGWFAKRVALMGGESTGKTTMARRLAEAFGTLWVPEVGRFYVEEFGDNQNDAAIWRAILSDQKAFEDHTARQCNKLVVCDTDLLTTSIWYRAWVTHPDRNHNVLSRLTDQYKRQHRRSGGLPYDLYIFLDHNVDWINDGTRSEGHRRQWFTDELMGAIKASTVPFVMIDEPTYEERFQHAVDAIQMMVMT